MKKILIFTLSIMFSFGMLAAFVAPAYAADGEHESQPLVTSMTFDKETYNWKDTITVRVDYTSNIDLKGMINLDCVGINTGLMFFFSPGSWEESEGLLTYEEGYDPDTGKGYVIYHRTANPSDPIDDYSVYVESSSYYEVDHSIWEKYSNKEPQFSIRPFGDRDAKYCASDIENAQEKIDALADGDTLVITLHGNDVFKKEWFDAIKGRDITIVIPKGSYGFVVFNGKDIVNETKDVVFSTSISGGGRADDDDGGPWYALTFAFPDNGVLPCKSRFYYSYDYIFEFVRTSIDSRYITPEDVMREMELYYINNGMLVHEADGISNNGEWIILELEHNSNFLATSFAPELVRTFNARLSKSVFKYNGKVQKPSVKHSAGADVKDIYSNKKSKNIGAYKVTVTGRGDDCGIKMMKYTIIPPDVSGLKVVSGGSKRLMVSYKKAAGGVKYQVAYRLKNASKWKTVSVKGTARTLTNLKAGKTYQVKVRAYKKVNGETYYGAWTKAKERKL